MRCAPYVAPPMAGHFRHNAVFIGSNVREAINDGRADYTPIYLSEIEELFESGAMPIDVALVELSPPDSQGYCSFGVGVDTTLTDTKCARHVVAQINSYMSRTFGDSFIHISDIDAMVESSRPLCEPLMKAEFSIYPITATETYLDFRGHYEPPLGVMGKTVDAVAGCRVAEVSVHGFLSDVAAYLRQTLTSEPSRLH